MIIIRFVEIWEGPRSAGKVGPRTSFRAGLIRLWRRVMHDLWGGRCIPAGRPVGLPAVVGCPYAFPRHGLHRRPESTWVWRSRTTRWEGGDGDADCEDGAGKRRGCEADGDRARTVRW